VARRLFVFGAVMAALVLGGWLLIRFAGEGATVFRVDGAELFVEGLLSGASTERIERLLEEHQQLEVVVLGDMPGADDTVWLTQMGYLIRAAGLDTRAEGQIANDAILLFAAGVNRELAGGDLVLSDAATARDRGWPLDTSDVARVVRRDFLGDMVGTPALAEAWDTGLPEGRAWVLSEMELRQFGLLDAN